jgi:hypothetical protein
MANNLKSMIRVIANEDAIESLNERLDKCKTNDIISFANAFYDNVETTEDNEVLNSWSIDNLGSKWTYLYDSPMQDELYIESANYPPLDFFKHLYSLMVNIDPNVIIEVKYEDETYNPIGAVVIKKDNDGVSVMYQDEDDEMEDPTEDMNWDDEGYDDARLNFMDEIMERQDEMLRFCYDMIEEGDGTAI